jgi:hypothetical protein
VGVCLYVARPLVSARYLALYARSVYVLHYHLTVDLRGCSLGGASAGGRLWLSSLYLVAFLAALSAALFPGMPTWAGIYLTVTGRSMSWSSFTCCAISARM